MFVLSTGRYRVITGRSLGGKIVAICREAAFVETATAMQMHRRHLQDPTPKRNQLCANQHQAWWHVTCMHAAHSEPRQ